MLTLMHVGQSVTREALEAAMIAILPLRDAVKVAVICGDCGTETTTWIHPTDTVVPYVRCNRCYDALIHATEFKSPSQYNNEALYSKSDRLSKKGALPVGAARSCPLAWTGR